jgi:hypothetical protein
MENKMEFLKQAKNMWAIKDSGLNYELPIDYTQLDKLNVGKFKVLLIKKLLPYKNVNYSVLGNRLFLHESNGISDWIQNFMCFNIKIKTGSEYVKVDAGFYLTAMSIFHNLKENGNLTDNLSIWAYSHGAGASPLLALRIYDEGFKLPQIKGNFEPPRCIYKPSKEIKKLCEDFQNFKQGVDIVTTVPWWLSHLGIFTKIKGQKLPWYKAILKPIFDHDIYWTGGKK